MKCLNCGAELTEDAKFCSCCGAKVEPQTDSSEIVAEQAANVDPKSYETSKDEYFQPQNIENKTEKTFGDKIKDKIAELWGKLSLYGKFSTIAISVFALLFLIAFLASRTLSAIIAMLSLALIVVALLIKKDIIKTPKKWLHIIAIILAIVLIVPYFSTFSLSEPSSDFDSTIDDSCFDDDSSDNDDTTENEDDTTSTPDYKIDYYDAASFEKALNNGTKVNGKIVQFDVLEYKPDSALGINCWSGEHLNFISEEELNVSKGSIVIGRVTKEPTKTLGSWKIPYEVFSISGEKIEDSTADDTTAPETTTPETTPPETKITMSADSSSYAGKQRADVEKEFKDKGFTNISIYEVKTTDSNNPDGQVTSVSAASDSFKKGDKFEKDVEIIIYCWKYEKPQSEYEKAYIRDMSNYDLYYMFDTDKKTVVYFGTNDTYIEKGTYTGDFATGVTITWSHGEWTEKFTHKSGNSATMIDGSGWDWEYKVCDIAKAQKVLDGLSN